MGVRSIRFSYVLLLGFNWVYEGKDANARARRREWVPLLGLAPNQPVVHLVN